MAMYFNTNFISRTTVSEPLRSNLHARGWLWRLRQTAPRLMLVLVLLGQLGGQTSYHVVEGMTAPSYTVDSDDLPAVFTNPPASSPTVPMSLPLPQSHVMHLVHCQFAPSLSIIGLPPLLIVLMLSPSRRLIPPQMDLTPITPPPIRTPLMRCRFAR
jgi:hypothetical protein